MAIEENNRECTTNCWRIAAIAGLVSMVVLYWMVGFGLFQALFTGILLGVLLGLVLILFLCRSQTSGAGLPASEKPAMREAAATAPAPARAAEVPASAPAAAVDANPVDNAGAADVASDQDASAPAGTVAAVTTTPASSFAMKPSKALPGQDELASRKGSWKYEKPASEVTAGSAAKAPKAPKAAAKPKAAKASKAATADAAQADVPAAAAAPKRAAVASDGKPELMDAPRAGGKDDLKLISGVGPKLEGVLNSLGVYHFDQVARWRKKEVAWVDANLPFKGRIERDSWISQAKVLAKGGETEFSKKKKT